MEYVGSAGFGVIRLTLFRPIVHNIIKEGSKVNCMEALLGMYEKPGEKQSVSNEIVVQSKDDRRYICGPTPK